MNTTDKQKKLVELLETPKEDRPKYLKFPSQIKKQLGISPIQYEKWEKEYNEAKFRDVQEQLNKLTSNLQELEAIAFEGNDKRMANLARQKMWVIGMHEGNYKSLESYLKATGEFIEKQEQVVTYVITAEDREQIAERAAERLRDFSERGSGKNSLPAEPALLSG